ncbi:MAG: hypothetical protein IT267_03700 [Saprospiraceae bacterium]|nr:hypothetical protein [Saprospiraceae bacterium]
MTHKLLPYSPHNKSSIEKIKNVHFYNGLEINLQNFDVAIINNDPDTGKILRNELYDLHISTHSPLAIIDLGDAFAMNESEITDLVFEIIECQCYPILIGFNQSLSIALSKQWQTTFKPHCISWIMSKYSQEINTALLDNIFLKQQYALCLQRQMNSLDYRDQESNSVHYSFLSEFRKSIISIENFTRNSELFFFDLQSLRYSDFPASTNPSGLFAEEMIALSKLSGSSDKSLVSIISNWPLNNSESDKTSAMLVSQMIWYIMEGYILKLKDKQNNFKNLKHYVVELKSTDIHLDFYKSEHSGKWWFREPTMDNDLQGKLIPCTYDEYLKTVHENLPDRLMQLISQ